MRRLIVYFISTIWVKQRCHFCDSRSRATTTLHSAQTDRQADGLKGQCCQTQHPSERDAGVYVKYMDSQQVEQYLLNLLLSGVFLNALESAVISLCPENTELPSTLLHLTFPFWISVLLHLSICLFLNAELSVAYLFVFSFLSAPSYSPASVVVESSLSSATDCSPWAYWENESWDCLRWRRVTGSKRG